MNKSKVKLFYGIAISILFLLLGFKLIGKEDKFAITIGYISIAFWSGMILLAFYKLATKKQ